MTRRIFAGFLLIAMLLCAVGCNEATSARDAVERFEAAMKENDYKTAFAYVADYDGYGFDKDKDTERIINAVSSSLSVNILNDSSSATNALFDADITTIDLRQVYCDAASVVIPQYYTAALAGEDISANDISIKMMQEVIAMVEGPGAPTVTTRVPLTVSLSNDNEWLIRLDVVAYNAITGYLDEANNLITTGTIVQAINGETDFLSGEITQPPEVSPSDVSASDAAEEQ
ncbi:MAG: hypothetical protein E7554_10430 [Ruminococcaceae bacterium]|nr:hypothetical protein [Oscillospiraceae bacterium]